MSRALSRSVASRIGVLRTPLVAVALGALGACSDADDGTTPAPAPGTPLTIWVLDEPATPSDPGGVPLAGVTIAIDRGDGADPTTVVTSADGRATFEADFAQRGVNVTVVSANHAVLSVLDVSPAVARARGNAYGKPEGDLVVVPPRLASGMKAAAVELRGALAGKVDPTSTVDVSVSGLRRFGADETTAAEYALLAPKGAPFFLLGYESRERVQGGVYFSREIASSFRIESPARAADGTLDIDVAKAPRVSTKSVKLRLEPPAIDAAAYGVGSRGYATVVSADSRLLVGPMVQGATAGGGRGYDVEMAVAETVIVPERTITRSTIVASDGARAVRNDVGVLVSGATVSDFLAVPVVRDPDASRSLADPLPLVSTPAGADVVVELYVGDELAWVLEAPPGRVRDDTIRFPPPPNVFSADVQIFGARVTARSEPLFAGSKLELFRRTSSSRGFVVRKR